MAVHDTLLPHRVDVEMRPAVPTQDASGGLVDSAWSVEFSQVPCLIDSSPPTQMYDFATAGVKVIHTVQMFQAVQAGRRLKLADGRTWRVTGYARDEGQGGGTIPDWFAVAAEEIRLS